MAATGMMTELIITETIPLRARTVSLVFFWNGSAVLVTIVEY